MSSNIAEIRDQVLAEEILLSPDFDVVDFRSFYRALGQKYKSWLGTDFFYAAKSISYLPNFIPREEHDEPRAMAKACLRGVFDQQRIEIRKAVGENFERLGSATHVDLIRDFIAPVYDGAWNSLFRIDPADIPIVEEVGLLISGDASLAERVRLDRSLADLVAKYCGEREREEHLMPLFVLYLTGRNLTLGSLAKSLYLILEANIGISFSQIEWPRLPVASTVAYVDRRCLREVTLSDRTFKTGEFVRCYIDTDFQSIRQQSGLGTFGPKNRECLGKTLVISIWREIVFQAKDITIVCDEVVSKVENVSSISYPQGGLVLIRSDSKKGS